MVTSPLETLGQVALIVGVGAATVVSALALTLGLIVEGTKKVAHLLGYRSPVNPRHARRR